jgi:hypothetical protein
LGKLKLRPVKFQDGRIIVSRLVVEEEITSSSFFESPVLLFSTTHVAWRIKR